jgi:hypothetical protein
MKPPRKTRRGPLGVLARVGLGALLIACGSRTGLFGEEAIDDGFTILPDGGRVPRDGSTLLDGATFDAPPLIDATPRDASRLDCPDAEATLIYVVTGNNELYSFFPPDGTFTFIFNIACPSGEATPFSMAVDRHGVAYVLFTDNRLYRVSTATGACISTPFQPNQQGFGQFGMGYATNAAGPTETLFVAADESSSSVTGLARIDTATFALTRVGPFVPNINRAELTGTGDGRLFAFYTKGFDNGPPSYIGEINTDTARIVAETPFPTVDQGGGWAFAFWGGDFYMFTSPGGGGSDVTRWRPSDNSVNNVGTLPSRVVGAGVSTCAPAQ